jgi:hypothetical protein
MFMTLAGRDDNGAYQVLVGDPKMAADTLGVELWPHSMKEVYDNIARGLERIGFTVVRNPLPLVLSSFISITDHESPALTPTATSSAVAISSSYQGANNPRT